MTKDKRQSELIEIIKNRRQDFMYYDVQPDKEYCEDRCGLTNK